MRIVIAVWMVSAIASAAFAGGMDLSITACPGNPGALGGEAGAVVTDCAQEPVVTLLGTFSTQETLPDLVGIDGLLDVSVQPDLDASPFWNVDPNGCGASGLNSNHVRPVTGCTSYVATWSAAGSGSAIAALRRGPSAERIAFTAYRPTPLSVTPSQKLFGIRIVFNSNADLGTSCGGCTAPVAFVWTSTKPGTVETTASDLSQSTGNVSGFDNCIALNGGTGACSAVPSRRRTWGRLKSLYR